MRHLALAAAALLIAGCGGLPTPTAEQPADAAKVAEVIEAPKPTDYLAEGKENGYSAAVAAQDATGNDWKDVGLGWDAAMRSLRNVPADSPDYAEAQAKIAEYTANREVASDRYNAHLAELKARQATAQPVAPRSDPTARALQAYHAAIVEADPTGAAVSKVEELGMDGAAGVTVTESWQLLPAISRENSAKDLHNIWVGEVVKVGGSRSSAQILIFNRHGKTIAQVHAGGVKLKE